MAQQGAAELTKQGIAAYNAGDTSAAAALFQQATAADPGYEMAWLWRASTAETDAEKRAHLEQALAINPASAPAKRGLAQLGATAVAPPPELVKAVAAPAEAPPPITVIAPRRQGRRWAVIAAVVVVVVVLVGVGFAAMQSGVTGIGLSATPESTLAPTPSCVQESVAFVAQVEPLAREWDDANKLADSTPRASLSGQIDKLQAIRRRTEDIAVPACAAAIKQGLVLAMDAAIRGYIAFLAQKPDSDVNALFTLATYQMNAFKQVAQAVKAGKTMPMIESPLVDGLGITQAAIQEAYQKEGFTFDDSPLADGRARSFGNSKDKITSFELIGPPENIRQASMFAELHGGSQVRLETSKNSLREFLKTIAADWDEGDAWLTTAMNASEGGPKIMVDRGRIISYERTGAGGGDSMNLVIQVP